MNTVPTNYREYLHFIETVSPAEIKKAFEAQPNELNICTQEAFSHYPEWGESRSALAMRIINLLPRSLFKSEEGIRLAAAVYKVDIFSELTEADKTQLLHRSAKTGDPALLLALIKSGVDINTTYLGMSFIDFALFHCSNIEYSKTLLRHGGIDLNKPNKDGSLILHRLCNISPRPDHLADRVAALIEAGANPCLRDEEESTPLILASQNGYDDVVALLLKHDKHLDADDKEGNTALIHACFKGHAEVVDLLIAAGADVNKRGQNGFTPLMVGLDNRGILIQLINTGKVILGRKNALGQTIHEYALARGGVELANDIQSYATTRDLVSKMAIECDFEETMEPFKSKIEELLKGDDPEKMLVKIMNHPHVPFALVSNNYAPLIERILAHKNFEIDKLLPESLMDMIEVTKLTPNKIRDTVNTVTPELMESRLRHTTVSFGSRSGRTRLDQVLIHIHNNLVNVDPVVASVFENDAKEHLRKSLSPAVVAMFASRESLRPFFSGFVKYLTPVQLQMTIPVLPVDLFLEIMRKQPLSLHGALLETATTEQKSAYLRTIPNFVDTTILNFHEKLNSLDQKTRELEALFQSPDAEKSALLAKFKSLKTELDSSGLIYALVGESKRVASLINILESGERDDTVQMQIESLSEISLKTLLALRSRADAVVNKIADLEKAILPPAVEIPDHFLCSITGEMMKDPVTDVKYGHNYEREAIVKWLTEHQRSPLTMQPLTIADLKDNAELKQQIQEFAASIDKDAKL